MTDRSAAPLDLSRSLLDVLWWRARHEGDRIAYITLVDGETEGERCTYAELAVRVRAIAVALRPHVSPGESVMVLHPPGVEYVAALLGCMTAGAVAIPLHPPRRRRGQPRFEAIREDAGARVALTREAALADARDALAADRLTWIATDTTPEIREPVPDPKVLTSDIAYLQYTSGSTGTPRGVMVSHANLMSNLRDSAATVPATAASRMVSWLPLFHDMGLVYGALYPLYGGFLCYLMEPAAFQQEPLRWLRAISRYGATHTGAPNSAYALCAERADAAARAELRLDHWEVAACGAEPLRADTLERFAVAFAPCGFRRAAFAAGYGLAEATLLLTSEPGGVRTLTVSAAALARDRVTPTASDGADARSLASVGRPQPGTSVLVVNVERGVRSGDDEVGEVWAAGPGVSAGYWNRPDETRATFGATLPGDARSFLRTGDLGFIHDGRLYITGRSKDLIIVRGLNHYPQDIEWTAGGSHSALRPNSGAAFSVDVDGAEALVVVQEVRRAAVRTLDADEVVRAVRGAVTADHGVAPHAVLLLRPGGLPLTPSGKPRRRECRRLFDEGALPTVAIWRHTPELSALDDEGALVATSREALETWLRARAARQLGVPTEAIDVREPLARYGFDSLAATELAAALARRLGRPVSPTLAYDHPTIVQLARHLSEDPVAVGSPTAASHRSGPSPDSVTDAIAVVGMACRFPGAPDIDAFTRLLFNGYDAVRELPPDRWSAPARRGLAELPTELSSAVTRGGWLESVDGFDARFFGISAREAVQVDPQQRLLLEVAWEALEHGAIAPDRLAGREVGVFVGISGSEYHKLMEVAPERLDPYAGTGSALSIAANRLSYILDLRGPSLAIDTACSSSLVALHAACEQLRGRRVELAIAGGVNLILTPDWSVVFARAGMLARDGRCKTFDARADGYVRGEGCGVVVLKRLADALRDGDRIHAVVLGSAVNQDGRSNGLTAPNGPSQQAVARRAIAAAGIDGSAVGYVEAHGTGTALGDPIELHALRDVYGGAADQPCRIGAVKTNIGHLEAAAGIAGFIKTVLVLERGEIPANLHFGALNPEIDLRGSRLNIADRRAEWPRPVGGRYAAVSSFGFGGTNAHVVLGEAPSIAVAEEKTRRAPRVLAISARDPDALRVLAAQYAEVLANSQRDGAALDALCRTAVLGRARLDYRLAIAAPTADALRGAIGGWLDGRAPSNAHEGVHDLRRAPRVAFLFAGQDTLGAGVGRRLFEWEPVFRDAVVRCEAAARASGASVLGALHNEAQVSEPGTVQAVLFAVGYALAELWRAWGVVPQGVAGHGLGEHAAACVSGVLAVEEAMRIVVERGRLMEALDTHGDMRFPERVRRLATEGCNVFVEIGAAPMLLPLARSALPSSAAERWVGGLRPGCDDHEVLADSIAELHVLGVPVDWAAVHADTPTARAKLPSYPFQRRRCWVSAGAAQEPGAATATSNDAPVMAQVATASEREVVFETRLDAGRTRYLAEHRVNGELWTPAATFVTMALNLGEILIGGTGLGLENVRFERPLPLVPDLPTAVQVVVSNADTDADARTLHIASAPVMPGAPWVRHVSATLRAGLTVADGVDLTALRAACPEVVQVDRVYARLSAVGLEYGPSLRGLREVFRGERSVLARIVCPGGGDAGAGPRNAIHPVLLDACFQSLAALLPEVDGTTYVPASCAFMQVNGPFSGEAWCHADLRSVVDGEVHVDINVLSASSSTVLARFEGLTLRRLAPARAAHNLPRDCLYTLRWMPAPLAADSGTAWPPTPAVVCAEAEAALQAPAVREALRTFAAARPALETASRGFALAALRAVGALRPGRARTVDEIASASGIAARHVPLLQHLLEGAAESGAVQFDRGEWSFTENQAEPPDPQTTLAALRGADRRVEPELALLDVCGPSVADVLTGRRDPLELLFGDGDGGPAAALYHTSSGACVLNAATHAAVLALVASAPPDRTLRILEIGGGTGGATAALLPALQGARVEYTFTDVSALFVARARTRFGAHAGFVARALDIEREPASQGMPLGTYDVIVAANVLHATRVLARTLANVRALLAPHGMLLLVEGTTRQPLLDITVGLTDGWWRFEDRELRPSYPLLDAAAWAHALGDAGFAETTHVTPGAAEGWDFGQALIVAARSNVAAARWLVLADGAGVGAALARRLAEFGEACVVVHADGSADGEFPATDRVDPHDAEAVGRVVVAAAAGSRLCGVVHLWALDAPATEDAKTGDEVMTACLVASAGLLHVVQALVNEQEPSATPPRLWIVTRGAQAAPDHGGMPGVLHAPLWGMGRTLAFEHPQLRCIRIDLDPMRDDSAVERLTAELQADSHEEEIAFRGGARYAARIAPVDGLGVLLARPPGLDELSTYELAAETPGELDSLRLRRCARRTPGPGEVELRVDATALHFRDLLAALGTARGDADASTLGSECAGMIVRVGPGVSDLMPGDAVVALADGAFRGHLTVPAKNVAHRPAALRAHDAVDVGAFVTARLALERAALAPGDTVLVHAAAGATGLAAVAVAQRLGAEVLGTASPWKWPALRARGVRHLFHSREIAFGEQARLATGGAGVHAVLNSLTGAAVHAGIAALREGGCFIELGKAKVMTSDAAHALRPDVRYRSVDLVATLRDESATVRRMMTETAEELASGGYGPLPRQVFPLAAVKQAFRHMQQAQHVGRVVVDHRVADGESPHFASDATYLITGGLGGLGLLVSQWMAARGARRLVLLGRHAPDDAALRGLAALADADVVVRTVTADVADPAALASVLNEIAAGDVPLRGVIHLAGLLDDSVLARQNTERFVRVFRPKVAGAWELHRQTRHLPLDFFVLFSSAAALLGAPGQANHAAANAFMDALAHHRRSCGLPACSIQWGAWSDIGAAARKAAETPTYVTGLATIAPSEGLALLGALWAWPSPVVAAVRTDWGAVARSGAAEMRPFLELAIRQGEGAKGAASSVAVPVRAQEGPSLLDRLRAAPEAARRDLMSSFVREQASLVLGLPSSAALGDRQGFFEMGLDSLTSLELRNALQREIGRPLQSTVTFDHPTVEALSEWLLAETMGRGTARAGTLARDFGDTDTEEAALAALGFDELAAEVEQLRAAASEPIAIIGMGCRFPGGADSPDALWKLLLDEIDAVEEVPSSRWSLDEFYDADPDAPGKTYARYGAFLSDIEGFDATFFGISPREASLMDPQHRLALEVSWETLEHAAIDPGVLAGSATGVFLGISSNDYTRHVTRDPKEIDAYVGSGNAHATAAGRISFVLGLQGPCVALDTACSSSLVAVHLACQSLRARECELALAGGVGVLLAPEVTINFAKARMLAPDGRCKAFDAAADGYVRGEGCGFVALKRLADARAAGDRVIAVLRGSAVNHDGKTSGLTVPNGSAQERVVREALARAGLAPNAVGYIEAHGTGTAVGDPIELHALARVFGERAADVAPLLVGSVKTNIGHLEAAAGIAGLLKAALCVTYGEVPRSLHLHSLNPRISLDGARIAVAATRVPWPGGAGPRTAGVSSFGFGGTNAHVVVEAAPAQPADRNDQTGASHSVGAKLLVLSARSANALAESATRHAAFLELLPDDPATLATVCRTTQTGRMHFEHRLAVIADTPSAMARVLTAFAAGDRDRDDLLLSGAIEPPDAACVIRDDAVARELAALYVRGASVDWRAVWEGCRRASLPLPSYPFQRSRHWVPHSAIEARSTAGARLSPTYEVRWESSGTELSGVAGRMGTWLLVVDDAPQAHALADALGARLAARGHEARLVDAAEVTHALTNAAGPVRGVVHLCGFDAQAPSVGAVDGIERGLTIMRAVVTAGRRARDGAPGLWLVTRGAVATTPEEPVTDPFPAALWGARAVCALEHPACGGGAVDLDRSPRDDDADRLVDVLLAPGAARQMALRGGHSLDARLHPAVLSPDRSFIPRADRTYLITGGTGALGTRLAERLIARGARHLVLVSRRGGAAPGLTDRLAAWCAAGANVQVQAADVADPNALAAVLEAIRRTGPPLGGVLHAAGVAALRPLVAADDPSAQAAARAVLRAKVAGGWLLHELTRGVPLDLFVCFSSLSALWGAPGLAEYASANRFLDALAAHRRGIGLPALSVNWGPWGGEGMAASGNPTGAEQGISPLAPDRALDTLEALLGADRSHAVVADVNWSRFAPRYAAVAPSGLLDHVAPPRPARPAAAPGAAVLRSQLDATRPAERERLLRQHLRAEVARVLGYTAPALPDPEVGLFELGFDSLMAVELARALEEALGMALPVTLAIDHPTIAALATHLAAAMTGTRDRPVKRSDRESNFSPDDVAQRLAARLQTIRAQRASP